MADPNRMQEDWQSQSFRSKIIARLDEALRNGQTQISRSSVEMEECVFHKARSRDEYLDLVARVLLSVDKDKKMGQPQGMVPQNIGMPGGMRAPGQDQDPINALQNLAGQGTGGMGRAQPGGMISTMPGMVGAGSQASQMVRQPMMQHVRGPMPQRPPQLHRHDAFMVTSPQSMHNVPGQPIQVTSTAMNYPGPPVPPRTMVPMGMQNQPYAQVRDVTGMQVSGIPIHSPGQGSPITMMPSPHSAAMMQPSPSVRLGAPSPNTMLHTPGAAIVDPSPGPPSTSQEENEYVKKLIKLSRYIDPLSNFIVDLEKKNDEESKKNYKKMKSLLDILSNPKKRVPMVVLEKCEQVLVRMTISSPSSSSHGHMCQPLLDAIAHFSGATSLNHSLYRTFGPALEAYMGPPIKAPSPPPSRKRKAEDTKEILDELPDLVQGEIARLGQRFIVSVDHRHHSRSEAYHLICKLEEPLLPSVPPLLVTIPKSYPRSSLQCDPSSCPGYDSTEFFQNVEKNLTVHLACMPNRFCLTQLLGAWEMSVRKASDPVNPLISQPCPIFV